MRNCLVVLLDGVGDRPIFELGNKTPLQFAKTPNMTRLSEWGQDGLMDPVAPGIRPGSDTSHLLLFGYDPHEYYTGRGWFEAAGAGIDLRPGDVAFRCNWATLDQGKIADRRAGRIKESEGTLELAKALDGMKLETVKGVEVIVRASTEHRLALVFRGKGLSDDVSGTDPRTEGHPPQKAMPRIHEEEAQRTAMALNEFSKKALEILSVHKVNAHRKKPANYVLARGAGSVRQIPSFESKNGLSGAVVAKEGMIVGLARVLGMDVIVPKGATANLDTDLAAKAHAALAALKTHDYVFLHIKGTDVASHDGDFKAKVAFIEKIDAMLGKMLDAIDLHDTLVVLTADHSTPCEVRDHSGDPVPIVMAGANVRLDDVAHFDEVSAAKGYLYHIRGSDLMNLILNFLDRGEKYGA